MFCRCKIAYDLKAMHVSFRTSMIFVSEMPQIRYLTFCVNFFHTALKFGKRLNVYRLYGKLNMLCRQTFSHMILTDTTVSDAWCLTFPSTIWTCWCLQPPWQETSKLQKGEELCSKFAQHVSHFT